MRGFLEYTENALTKMQKVKGKLTRHPPEGMGGVGYLGLQDFKLVVKDLNSSGRFSTLCRRRRRRSKSRVAFSGLVESRFDGKKRERDIGGMKSCLMAQKCFFTTFSLAATPSIRGRSAHNKTIFVVMKIASKVSP